MNDQVTPTEAVIARLTVENEQLKRELYTLREKLSEASALAEKIKEINRYSWGPV